MDKLSFSIVIDAPKEKVWHTMLDKETYPQWTDVFMPGSDYEGGWNKGDKILFIAPDNEGKIGGMVSRIAENKKYEFVSIEHLGEVHDGVEDTTSEAAKAWAGAHENYTFNEKNGKTEVVVDLHGNIADEFKEMFEGMWPKALAKVKDLAEK